MFIDFFFCSQKLEVEKEKLAADLDSARELSHRVMADRAQLQAEKSKLLQKLTEQTKLTNLLNTQLRKWVGVSSFCFQSFCIADVFGVKSDHQSNVSSQFSMQPVKWFSNVVCKHRPKVSVNLYPVCRDANLRRFQFWIYFFFFLCHPPYRTHPIWPTPLKIPSMTGDSVTRSEDRDIRSASGRLPDIPDNLGSWRIWVWDKTSWSTIQLKVKYSLAVSIYFFLQSLWKHTVCVAVFQPRVPFLIGKSRISVSLQQRFPEFPQLPRHESQRR